MKCSHCGSAWDINPRLSVSITNCPFCGTSLLQKEKKLETIEEVLSEITRQFGVNILTDETKLIAYFSDLAPHLSKQRRILDYFVECGGPKKIFTVMNSPENEQTICINQIVKKMTDELYIEENASQMICNAFLCAVSGHPSAKPREENPPQFPPHKPEAESVQELTAEEQFRKGEEYFKGTNTIIQDHTQAFIWYQKAANREHVMAQYQLGLMFFNGQGTTKDESKAVEWFTRAAKQNLVAAQEHVGRCYLDGCGVEKLPSEAFFWYQKAADNGSPQAAAVVGMFYESGIGCIKNESTALMLYAKSVQMNSSSGLVMLMLLLARKKNLSESDCNVFMHAIKGIDKSLEDMMLSHKDSYYIALQLVRHSSTQKTGLQIITLLANKGNVDAQLWLGQAYDEGSVLARNPALSIQWYQKAAYNGSQPAVMALRKLRGFDLSKDRLASLIKQHQLGHKYLIRGDLVFYKKIYKALDEYAPNAIKEGPILMEDSSVSGAAKSGFVLTQKAIYYSDGTRHGKCRLPIDRIESISISSGKPKYIVLNIMPNTPLVPRTSLSISFASSDSEATRLKAFWCDLLNFPPR